MLMRQHAAPRLKGKDMFCGLGGFTLAMERVGIDCTLAVNHWDRAIRVHAANHRDTEHLQRNLLGFKFGELDPFDILTAGVACIPGDARVVLGKGGDIAAADLQIGDLVLTHEGRARPVVNKWSRQYTGPMVSLLMWGDTKRPIRTTADHKIWVRRQGGHVRKLGEPRFVRADEVRVGDYVGWPRQADDHGLADRYVADRFPQGAKIKLTSTADLWWLIGHFLGDGEACHPTRYRGKPQWHVGWSTGGNTANLNRVKAILEAQGLPWRLRGTPSNQRIFTTNKHLHTLCTSFGRLCHEKNIPAELERLDRDTSIQLVLGYMAADGHRDRPHVWGATSTSLMLLQGLQRLCWRIGWTAGIQISDYARKAVILGRNVNCRDTWSIRVTDSPHAQSRTKFTDGFVWRSVREVTAAEGSETVFDFEVAEDHTFCLPGVIVHNCQPHSDAGQIGRASSKKVFDSHAQMRATAWAVWKCAQVCRPKYLIVENVRGFIRWRDLQRWLAALRKLGYAVTQQFLCASRFGLPQRRWRWFFIGVLGGPPVQMVNPDVLEPGVGTIFDASAPGWIDIEDMPDRPSKAQDPTGELDADGEPVMRPRYLSAREKARQSNERLNGELGIGQHTNYGYWGIPASEPVNTVTGQAGQLWWTRDGQYRLWTRNECKRAQGIPDSYNMLDSNERDAAKLIGNAVPIDLAMAVIRAATGRGDPAHLAEAVAA
jgi:site-specific DNA-cytosine methylase